MTEIVEKADTDNALIEQGPFRFYPTGAVVNGRPDFDTFGETFYAMRDIKSAAPFILGDLCNYGESAYGEKYSQFLDEHSYHDLANKSWVCRQIPIEHRREELTFSHHRQVASLENLQERVRWLEKAEKETWSARELKKQIQRKDNKSTCDRCNKWERLEEGAIYQYNKHKQVEYKVGEKGLEVCKFGNWIRESMTGKQMEREASECKFYEEDDSNG